jgi:lipoyl-dependent peroxiredoxin
MPVRRADAIWEGTLKDGKGTMKFGSGAFEGAYNFSSRFEEGPGTNPEELIGAAHAGCYSMALSADLGRAGFTAKRIRTSARVHVERVGGGFKLTRIELDSEAEVPGIDEKTFQETAEGTRTGCPVSQALTGVEIILQARLIQS